MSNIRTHWFSFGIILLWTAAFILGCWLNLQEKCANLGIQLLNREYYRWISALFLHANVIHLAFNVAAMYFIGKFLEPQIVPWKLLAFSLVIAIGTEAVFSYIFQRSESVGGSPILFALIGVVIATQITGAGFDKFRFGTWYGNWITGYAILANIPLFSDSLSSTLLIHGIPLILGAVLGYFGITLRLF